MRRILITLILFFSLLVVQAQHKNKRDSLLNLLITAKEDTNKVSLLLAIERNYFKTDVDSALYYNILCEKLISKLDAQPYKHRCFHDFIKIYHAKSDFRNALDYCLKSIKVAEQNKNKFQEATSYRAIFKMNP